MFGFRRRRPQPRASPAIFDLGRHALTLDDIRAHLIILGSSGSGKSFSTEFLLMALHHLGCPMLATGVKPDEHERFLRITRGERYVRVTPDGPHRLNLLDYLFNLFKSPSAVADFIQRLNEAVLRSGSSGNQEAYWANLFAMAMLYSIMLVHLAFGNLNIEWVYRTLSTAPRSRDDAKMPELLNRPGFGDVLREAIRNHNEANAHDLQSAIDFFNEFATIGDKGQGAVISMVNGTLGRMASGVVRNAFCTDTTLTPEIIERDRLTVLLDFPILKYGPPARLFQLAWTMAFQSYCLQRPAHDLQVPSILVRDECQFTLSPEWDMQVQTVARSQKLCQIAILQDIDVLQAALGGDARAEVEAHGFLSNHAVKLLFGNSNTRTGEYLSTMIGERKEFFASISSGQGQPETYRDKVLGVPQYHFSMNQQIRPFVTPSDFASLPTGECIVHQAGRQFDGKPYYRANLWRG